VPASGSAPLYAQEQGVPAELDQLLARMLELDADKRPANAEYKLLNKSSSFRAKS